MSIHAKLVEFHKKFNGAKKSGVNPHFRSEYMTLDDVVHATTPVLTELGLCAFHCIEGGDLVTAIADEKGDKIESRIPMTLNGNPQAAGSMVTYYKRYNLCALLNIAEADDDGNAAAAAAPEPPKPASLESLAALQALAAGNNQREAWYANNKDRLNEERAQSIIKVWKGHEEEAA